MEGIVFVPGIVGSALYYTPDGGPAPEQIWPPGPLDVFGYLETNLLIDPQRVSFGAVIDTVILPCVNVYGTTENDLRDISNKINKVANGPYLPAPYDWRINLFDSADQIERQISNWLTTNALTEITIVCHSMGGLLVRLLVESKYKNTPPAQLPSWLSITKRILFACTPHLGAPTALVEVLGLEPDVTISGADLKKLSNDSHFPSAYQLVPAASRSLLFNSNDNSFVKYDDPAVVNALGLSQANLTAADGSRAALDLSKKPDGIEYFFVYGTGQQTNKSIDISGLSLAGASVSTDDLGDGTVPSWSVTEAAAQHSPSIPLWHGPGDHLGILTTNLFRQELYNYFGLGRIAPLLVTAKPGVVVSTNKHHYKEGDTISVLLIPDSATEKLSGSLTLSRLGPDGKTMVAMTSLQKKVTVEGGPIQQHAVKIIAPQTPGAYRLDFEGDDATHATSQGTTGWFVVAPSEGATIRGLKPRLRRNTR